MGAPSMLYRRAASRLRSLCASKAAVSRCTAPICRSISVSYPVDDGPHNDAWKELLPPCFRVIDEVVRERKVEFPIRIGGGLDASAALQAQEETGSRSVRHRRAVGPVVFAAL